jgi:hypothetical protein
MAGENCSVKCETRDHETFGQCMRSMHVSVLGHNLAALGKWDAELHAYADARAKGIRPAGTTMAKVKAAERISDQLGRPYDSTASVRVVPE